MKDKNHKERLISSDFSLLQHHSNCGGNPDQNYDVNMTTQHQ